MKYEDIAQPWQQQQQASVVIPTRSNNRFFYKHHPKNWVLYYFETQVMTGKAKKTIKKPVWLPDLQAHHETPGVNGSRGYKNNPDSGMTRTRLLDKGISVLHPNQHDYLRSYPARGGQYWSTKFANLENLGGELIITFDDEAFAHWRLELMQKGALRVPHKQFLQRKQAEIQRRIERHTRSQHIPEIAAKLQGLKDLLTDMQSATNDVTTNGVNHYEL
jgi:hypothetical protein